MWAAWIPAYTGMTSEVVFLSAAKNLVFKASQVGRTREAVRRM